MFKCYVYTTVSDHQEQSIKPLLKSELILNTNQAENGVILDIINVTQGGSKCVSCAGNSAEWLR